MALFGGFIGFEDIPLEEIKEKYNNFELNDLKIGYFKTIKGLSTQNKMPGVFLIGKIGSEDNSVDMSNFLPDGISEYDITAIDFQINAKIIINKLDKKNIKGNYIGIKIDSPPIDEKISNLALKIGNMVKADYVHIRNIDSSTTEDLISIDIITNEDFNKYKEEVEKEIFSEGLKINKYTLISLE